MTDTLGQTPTAEVRQCLPEPASGERNKTGIVPVAVGEGVSGGEVWDLVCGLSDRFPIQEDWVRSLVCEFAKHLKEEPWRVLDLGAGTGNPAIGLASLGHQVVALDNDPWMVATCIHRAKIANASLHVVRRDWRTMSSEDLRVLGDGGPFNLILCLGNSLGYQDSWPDQEPSGPLTATRLADTLRGWTDALAPGGVIALEVALEDADMLPTHYVRLPPTCAADGNPALSSCWIVSVREDLVRDVDTLVYEQGTSECHAIVGRIRYRGHLITNDLAEQAFRRAGLAAAALTTGWRPYFSTYLLRHMDCE